MALINLRNALMTGKRTPTAKDYVQDGLIAMWDGIENAGWGVHDPNATTWKNLVSNSGDWEVTQYAQWTNNSLACDKTNMAASRTDQISTPVQQEYVLRVNSGQALNSIIVHERGMPNGYSLITSFNDTSKRLWVVPGLVGNSYAVSQPIGIPYAISVDKTNLASPIAYRDGAEITINNKSNTWYATDAASTCIGNRSSGGRGTECALFCIRYYSRALTASEIAANYAIDKARFGLP